MKKTTGLGLGLLAVGGITAVVGGVISARESKTTIAEKIVSKWAPIIIKELGITNDEGILNKITVSNEVLDNPTQGNIAHQVQYKSIVRVKGKYVKDSAAITIYAENMARLHIDASKSFRNFGLFGAAYRRMVFFTLAHELRHFWQLQTGEYHDNSILINGRDLTPYKDRWVEKDANAFALKLMKQYKKQI